jgi:hypothetical protein
MRRRRRRRRRSDDRRTLGSASSSRLSHVQPTRPVAARLLYPTRSLALTGCSPPMAPSLRCSMTMPRTPSKSIGSSCTPTHTTCEPR